MRVEREQWEDLMATASQQYGLVSRKQLEAVLSRGQIESRARAGVIKPAARGVWYVTGCPRSWRQRALAGCLSVGEPVAVSHLSAGRLWEFEDIGRLQKRNPQQAIDVTVPPSRSGLRRPALILHRAALPPTDITERHGIPTTTPIRTLGDLAPLVDTKTLSRFTDEAMRAGLIVPRDLERLRIDRYRRRGAVRLATVTELRVGGVGESAAEDKVFDWLVRAGLPPPVRQHVVELDGQKIRLDLAYPPQRVGIEFDGWKWHRVRGRFDRDRWKATELGLAGWTVVWVTSAQRGAEVVRAVSRALQRAG